MRGVAVGSIIHVEFTSAYVWLLIYRRGRKTREGGQERRTQLSQSIAGLCVLGVNCDRLPESCGLHHNVPQICQLWGPSQLREHRAVE